MAIMIYYGHEGGDIERDAVLDFVSHLPSKRLYSDYLPDTESSESATLLVMIEKLESYRHG